MRADPNLNKPRRNDGNIEDIRYPRLDIRKSLLTGTIGLIFSQVGAASSGVTTGLSLMCAGYSGLYTTIILDNSVKENIPNESVRRLIIPAAVGFFSKMLFLMGSGETWFCIAALGTALLGLDQLIQYRD